METSFNKLTTEPPQQPSPRMGRARTLNAIESATDELGNKVISKHVQWNEENLIETAKPDKKVNANRKSASLDERAFLDNLKDVKDNDNSKSLARVNSAYGINSMKGIKISKDPKSRSFLASIGITPKHLSNEAKEELAKERKFEQNPFKLVEWKAGFFLHLSKYARERPKMEPKKVLSGFLKTALSYTSIPRRLESIYAQTSSHDFQLFIDQYKSLQDPNIFMRKCNQQPKDILAQFYMLIGEGEILEYLCNNENKELIECVQAAQLKEELSQLKSLSTPVTQETVWELDFKVKLLEEVIQSPQKDPRDIVEKVLEISFQSTTIMSRIKEAHKKFEKEHHFLSRCLNFHRPRELMDFLIGKSLEENERKILIEIMGCHKILVKLTTDEDFKKKWVSQAANLKQNRNNEELLQKWQKQLFDRFSQLNHQVTEERRWKQDLFFSLTEGASDPKESAESIVARVLSLSFQATSIMPRIKEACQKDGIICVMLTPFLEVTTLHDFIKTLNKVKLSKQQHEIFKGVVGCWDILCKLTASDQSQLIDFVRKKQQTLKDFYDTKDPEHKILASFEKLVSSLDRFFEMEEIAITSLKTKDILETFRAQQNENSHESEIFTLNGHPLKIVDMRGVTDYSTVFMEWFVGVLLASLPSKYKEGDAPQSAANFSTAMHEAAKFTNDNFEPHLQKLKKIPVFPILQALSMTSYKEANSILRELLFPFFGSEWGSLQLRSFATTPTTYRIQINDTYQVTHVKSYSFFKGDTENHVTHATFEASWTILGSYENNPYIRKAKLEIKNFKLLTQDEKVLRELYTWLDLCLSFKV